MSPSETLIYTCTIHNIIKFVHQTNSDWTPTVPRSSCIVWGTWVGPGFETLPSDCIFNTYASTLVPLVTFNGWKHCRFRLGSKEAWLRTELECTGGSKGSVPISLLLHPGEIDFQSMRDPRIDVQQPFCLWSSVFLPHLFRFLDSSHSPHFVCKRGDSVSCCCLLSMHQ